MRKLLLLIVSLFALTAVFAGKSINMFSFDGRLRLLLESDEAGGLRYALYFKNQSVVKPSALGFKLVDNNTVLNEFEVVSIDSSTTDQYWSQVWGEQSLVHNWHKEIKLGLRSKNGIFLNIYFRLFNEGVGFRYEFPTQQKLNHFIIAEELTEFAMAENNMAFWIPGDYDTNEYSYYQSSLKDIGASQRSVSQEIYAKSPIGPTAVQTPLMMKSPSGLYINIHEAALLNYPAMNLVLNPDNLKFNAHLVPDAVGNKAYLQAPAQTPWRTIIVSDKAPEILMSRMILNLNEPNRIDDVSWIKPQKFVGVWWEMHVGTAGWDLAGSKAGSDGKPGRRHGANTENVKRYIDFASKNGIPAVLVEGWNTGWEDWFGQWKEDVFDFVTPYPDFNVQELSDYARWKGVKLIMHHETSASVTNYERWMDSAYRFMKKYGYDAVKTGYVGKIIPRGEHHDGQWMVKHYERVAKKTADYQIMVDMHEPVRPTGLHRTYPNFLACEAARGNEFNAWSSGNPPDHETILPFTRLMGGPMDYTPGIFKIKMNAYDSNKKEQVHTTLCKQLALYVTMYSPLQMAADLPENYEAHADAFQFIKDVPVDWEQSLVLDAEPGDYILQARKEKGGQRWFLGAITDEQARTLKADFSFLEPGKKYIATVYADASDAHWEKNPEAYTIRQVEVDNKTVMPLKLAAGGGTAISLQLAPSKEKKRTSRK